MVTDVIYGEIVAEIKTAKIRLRLDKVVQEVRSSLSAALSGNVPPGQSIVLTMTAPIKRPSQTARELADLLRGGLSHRELRKKIQGNDVRVRSISGVTLHMPKVVALVHN